MVPISITLTLPKVALGNAGSPISVDFTSYFAATDCFLEGYSFKDTSTAQMAGLIPDPGYPVANFLEIPVDLAG